MKNNKISPKVSKLLIKFFIDVFSKGKDPYKLKNSYLKNNNLTKKDEKDLKEGLSVSINSYEAMNQAVQDLKKGNK